ncbi:MAG: rRNA maturation RNase YbeY [Flavobacteriales bacterium]
MDQISYHYELDFELSNEQEITSWLVALIEEEKCVLKELTYIFCDDEYLLKINQEHLNHDYYTDIITFDYDTEELHSDLFISVDRVKDNAEQLNEPFKRELFRVVAHGVLHLCGYKDKTESEIAEMRGKEDYYLSKLIID